MPPVFFYQSMSDQIKWEGNPKNGFERRRLERLYNMSSDEVVPTKEEPPMGVKRRPSKAPRPYWNFWRAVFAGWLIRYPRQIFKMTGLVLLLLLLPILSMCSSPSEYQRDYTDRVNEVR